MIWFQNKSTSEILSRTKVTVCPINARKRLDTTLKICMFFYGTHEPIIDEETFELAQKRLSSRHRSCKSDIIDMYSNLIFCGDCGSKMYCQKNTKETIAYTCGKYRNSRNRLVEICSTHFIRQVILNELILADLNCVIESVKMNRK